MPYKTRDQRRDNDKIMLKYLASILSHVDRKRECTTFGYIFLHFVNTQYEYMHHIFLALNQNAPSASLFGNFGEYNYICF